MKTKTHTIVLALSILCWLVVAHAQDEEPVRVSADEIGRTWSQNEVRAKLRYSDKPLIITGEISSIQLRGDDEAVIYLDADETFFGIEVALISSELYKAADLNEGERVTLYCEDLRDPMFGGLECDKGRIL
ncbi:MAG: OB-fold protein [Pseudohongiellaceae bacterium]